MEKQIKISEKEQKILDEAFELLRPFNKEDVSHYTHYFEVDGDGGDLSEYDTCDLDECVKESLADVQKKYPDKEIETVWYHNDGDHESLDSCYTCSRPLNEWLTWIGQELDHHEEYTVSKEDIEKSRNAFDLMALFQSFPSCDHKTSPYQHHQDSLGNSKPLEEGLKRQEEFKTRVMNYAGKIISLLTS